MLNRTNERKNQGLKESLFQFLLGGAVAIWFGSTIGMIYTFSKFPLPNWVRLLVVILFSLILGWKLFIVTIPRGVVRVFLPLNVILSVKKAGPHFFPLGRLVNSVDIPQKIMELEYTVQDITTRKGRYYFDYPNLSEYLRLLKSLSQSTEEKKKIEEMVNEIKELIEPLVEEKFEKDEDLKKLIEKKENSFDDKVRILAQKMREGKLVGDEYEMMDCEPARIPEVKFGVYAVYPDSLEGIEKLLDRLGVLSTEELRDALSTFMEGSLREIGGRVTWMVLVANREHIQRELREAMEGPNTILVQAGLPVEKFDVRITEVELPEELKEILHVRQVARFKKEAAKETGEIIRVFRSEGADANIATMLAKDKTPTVIHMSGSGEGESLTEFGARFGMGLGTGIATALKAIMGKKEEGKKEEGGKKEGGEEKERQEEKKDDELMEELVEKLSEELKRANPPPPKWHDEFIYYLAEELEKRGIKPKTLTPEWLKKLEQRVKKR
jgi:predicted nucleic acid-binding protein